MINKTTLMGRLGADPEIRRLNSGDPVVSLRVATWETWQDKATGERKERTEWHQVVIFNEILCKVAEQYLRKGHLVYIEGQNSTRKWQDSHGQDRYTTEVVLRRFKGELRLLPQGGGKPGPAGEGDYGSETTRERHGGTGTQPERGTGFAADLNDEIPF